MSRPLPTDTCEVLTDNSLTSSNNLGLLLDKFAPWDGYNEAWDLSIKATKTVKEDGKKLTKNVNIKGGQAKGAWLGAHLSRETPVGPLWSQARIDDGLCKVVSQRWAASVAALSSKTFTAKVDYRLVVGFGAEHVLETGLCLHPVYGYPFIPGSALKGVARAQAFIDLAASVGLQPENWTDLDRMLLEGNEKKQLALFEKLPSEIGHETWREQSAMFCRVFGTTKGRGNAVFFDAFPCAPPRLDVDVLTPHYGEYYGNRGTKPPAEYLNPVPTYFLTVAAGTQFEFAVGGEDTDAVSAAVGWLKMGLKNLGCGGKTSAGYGTLTDIDSDGANDATP